MHCIPRPDPDVVVTALPGGDMILLHLGTRQYLSLNDTGAFLWNLMESSISLAGMSQALFERFEVTHDAAEQAVGNLIRDMKDHKLITLSHPEGGFA